MQWERWYQFLSIGQLVRPMTATIPAAKRYFIVVSESRAPPQAFDIGVAIATRRRDPGGILVVHALVLAKPSSRSAMGAVPASSHTWFTLRAT